MSHPVPNPNYKWYWQIVEVIAFIVCLFLPWVLIGIGAWVTQQQ